MHNQAQKLTPILSRQSYNHHSNSKSHQNFCLYSGQLSSTAPCLPQGSKAVLCVLPQQEMCACFNSKGNRLAVLDKPESKCLQIEWQRSEWCCELAPQPCTELCLCWKNPQLLSSTLSCYTVIFPILREERLKQTCKKDEEKKTAK